MKNILENALYRSDIEKVLGVFDFNAFNGKKFLITGGLGLICSSIIDALLVYGEPRNANIVIYVAARDQNRFLNRYGGHPCVRFIAYDATEPIGFDLKIDYIIHGAGLSSPELYVTKPVETMLSNFNGVLNLLRFAKNHNVSRMLYISSSEVYGSKKKRLNLLKKTDSA